jgi:septum formation protein
MIGRPKFVLASGSPRRVSLINQAGIEPDELRPANIDETPQRDELPRVCANRLAHAKAETALAGIGAGDEALAIDPERRHQNEMLTDVNAVAHVE